MRCDSFENLQLAENLVSIRMYNCSFAIDLSCLIEVQSLVLQASLECFDLIWKRRLAVAHEERVVP